jgi:8-oxo-dGTP diphosphatase
VSDVRVLGNQAGGTAGGRAMHEYYRHSVSTAAVTILDDGRVLAVERRDNGAWQIPGGILEAGEAIEAGLRREVAEETGLFVEPELLTGVYKHLGMGVVALVFRCRLVSGRPTTSEESSAVEWLAPTEVDLRMTPVFAKRVHDALAGPWPHVRNHDGEQFRAPDRVD